MANTDGFYVSLPSNTIHSSRENKTSHFYVEIPGKLTLKGHWEAALVEINLPLSWYNIPQNPPQNRTFAVYRKEFNVDDVYKRITDISEVRDVDMSFHTRMFPYGNYSSIESLIKTMNKLLKSVELEEENKDFAHIVRQPFITLEKENLKPILNVARGDVVWLPHILSDILCLSRAKDAEMEEKVVGYSGPPLTTVEDYNYLLFQNINKQYKSYVSDGVPSLTSLSSNIFIYSNIVSNEVVGNSQVPLLRAIRSTGQFGEDIQKVFISPYYKKVKQSEINEIEIKICDDLGELVKFEYGTVFLVIHFRRCQRSH